MFILKLRLTSTTGCAIRTGVVIYTYRLDGVFHLTSSNGRCVDDDSLQNYSIGMCNADKKVSVVINP